jgi:cytochrome c-type biogenesis protein CcmH/NrfG
MSQQKFDKAYEAYQQAVYRDGRNPTFWCSIGVLYYQINQFRDALDAYSRAIRLNPYISEVWYVYLQNSNFFINCVLGMI